MTEIQVTTTYKRSLSTAQFEAFSVVLLWGVPWGNLSIQPADHKPFHVYVRQSNLWCTVQGQSIKQLCQSERRYIELLPYCHTFPW